MDHCQKVQIFYCHTMQLKNGICGGKPVKRLAVV